MKEQIENLVNEFGEENRRLIENVVEWVEKSETQWGLETPIDIKEMIKDLLRK